MSKPSPKRLKKKKEREKLAKKKVLARRNAMRMEKIEENKFNKKLKRIKELKKDMVELDKWADNILCNMKNDTLSQLEKNAKILKEIEKEYEKEFSKKKKLNDDLEKKGLHSLQEKLNHLHNELAEKQKNEGVDLLDKKEEVAEVSVSKISDFDSKN